MRGTMLRTMLAATLVLVLAAAVAAPAAAQQGGDPFREAQVEVSNLGQSLWRLGVTVLLVISALLFLVAAGGTVSGILTGSTRSLVWGLAAVFGAAAVLLVVGGVIRNIIASAGGNLGSPPNFMP